MPWDANGRWIPENGNDSVANNLTGLLASNSRYIQSARAAGQNSANKRGLLNSSISAGAGEAAAINAALPIASQDAAQTFQRNQAVLEGGLLYDNQSRLAEQKFGFDTQLNTQQNTAQMARDQLGANTQLTLQQREAEAASERLQMQIAGATAEQLREFDQRTAEQLRSIAAGTATLTQQQEGAMALQRDAAGANERLQAQQNAAAKERLQLEQQGATEAQLREFDQRTAEQMRTIAGEAARISQQSQGQIALQDRQDAAARERILIEQSGATQQQLREFDQRTAEQIRALTAEQERMSQSQSGALALQRDAQQGQLTLQQREAEFQRQRDILQQEGATAAQLREFDQRTEEQLRSIAGEAAQISQQSQGQLALQEMQNAAAKERLQMEQAGASETQLREFDQRTAEQLRSISADAARISQQSQGQLALQEMQNAASSAQISQQTQGNMALQAMQDAAARERLQMERSGATEAQLREFDQRSKEQAAALSSNERTAMMGADTDILQTQIGANSQLSGQYLDAFSNLANNDAIPADVRNAYIAEFKRVMEQGQGLINVASNTPLNWGTGAT